MPQNLSGAGPSANCPPSDAASIRAQPEPQRGQVLVEDLGRDYLDGDRPLTVLDQVSFQVAPRQFITITGPSGSGKSTLLGLMAGLDRPTRGRVSINGTVLTGQGEDALARFRGEQIGFVFQNFQLLPTLTARENVEIPALLRGREDWAQRAVPLLEQMGLGHRLNHYPSQLSGGEMQRVAIARATVTHPAVVFADEPTGNLDGAAADQVLSLLTEARHQSTLVLVTHNPQLAALGDRQIQMRHGRIARILDQTPTSAAASLPTDAVDSQADSNSR